MKSSEQQIKQAIDNLRPKLGSVPEEWKNIQDQLVLMMQSDPSIANNSEIICSIIIFASKLTDSSAFKLLTNCISNGIGNFHSLWFTSIALVLEKQENYISALSTLEQANKIHVEPYPFLELKYNEFKKRMNERFQLVLNQKGDFNGNFTLNLGTLDGIEYIFNNGNIETKSRTDEPPQDHPIDVFGLIGFDPSSITSTPMNLTHNSLASINISNNASRQDNYVCGYNVDLLTGPDDKECSFEEQRLLSIGIDFIKNRKINANIVKQQSNPDSPIGGVVLPKKAVKNRKPLQPIDQEEQKPQQSLRFQQRPPPQEQVESVDSFFKFNGEAKPNPILKKTQNNVSSNNNVRINRNSSINNNNSSFSFINSNNSNKNSSNNNEFSVSPRNSRSAFVTFDNSAVPAGLPDRRRSPTPIARPSTAILVGEVIDSHSNLIGNLKVDSKIGDRTYLAKSPKGSFAVKRLTYSDAQNQALTFVNRVQHAELFALQVDPDHQSPDYFITKYFSDGNFETYINSIRNGKTRIDQGVSLFYLLQMIMILQQLEINGFIHGEINEKNLLLRISSDELSKKFGLNEVGWKDTGIVLIRCDQIQKISPMATSNLKKVDREAVYNLFIKSAIDPNQIQSGLVQYDCPKAWNKSIWKMVFDTLSTDTTLDPLMAMIIKELEPEQNCLLLIRKICMFIKKNLM